jgi:hypothetical protein
MVIGIFLSKLIFFNNITLGIITKRVLIIEITTLTNGMPIIRMKLIYFGGLGIIMNKIYINDKTKAALTLLQNP